MNEFSSISWIDRMAERIKTDTSFVQCTYYKNSEKNNYYSIATKV